MDQTRATHLEPHQTSFEWINHCAELFGDSMAIISADMHLTHVSANFFEALSIDDQWSPNKPNLLQILDIMYSPVSTQDDVSAFYNSLDDWIVKDRHSHFSETIPTKTGQAYRLQLKALTHELALLSFSPQKHISETLETSHADSAVMPQQMLDLLALGDSGFATYEIATNEFDIHLESFSEYIDLPASNKWTVEDFFNLFHPEDLATAKAAKAVVINEKRKADISVRLNTLGDKLIWLRARAMPVLDAADNIQRVLFFITDITNHVLRQEQLRQMADDIDKALKAKTSFLGRLSHEVRTPMNAVIGISDALIHHHGDPTILPKLELIQTSAEKIVRIVDETLQHSKLDEDKLELNPMRESPSKCVEMVYELWKPKAQKENITLTCTVDPSVPDEIIFDSFRYEQCLNNLLSNAVKFTPNGNIQIILTTISQDNEDKLILAVKDTGIGMSEEQQKGIFEAYTQADKSISGRFGGTGLGMNITKRIIELMGGQVSVRSQLGKGSVFVLTLPITLTESLTPVEETDLVSSLLGNEADINQSDYSKLSILVADDNSTNHMVVSSLLSSVVKDIHIAENGEEAIQVLKTKHIDLVLMDIHMPVMDGIEATLSIRGSTEPWSNVPIIALTADPQYQQKRLCRNIGMNAALAKPVKLNEILSAIDGLNEDESMKDVA